MIIGNGDIASVLTDKDDWLYFVSGVSDSQETRESEYQREKDLLLAQDRLLHVVYVSSLAVFQNNTRYYRHKREMEAIVKRNFPAYSIVRIGNITWGNNPHTLLNGFKQRAANGEPSEIRDEYRYLVDKEEFQYWIDQLPEWNCETAITGKRMKIQEAIDEYVRPHIS